jgi:hypothetical protein
MSDVWDDLVDAPLIHQRTYDIAVHRSGPEELLVRATVLDRKPPGLYVVDDPDPLDIHHMAIELRVSLPDLTIHDASLRMLTHPHQSCPGIELHYRNLIGMSIARGYSRAVKETFGGPRGCTHTTALLIALGPAVVQATWSVGVADSRGKEAGGDFASVRAGKVEANVNTCHVWDEEGEHVLAIRRGDVGHAPPLPVMERLERLGRSPDEWTRGR